MFSSYPRGVSLQKGESPMTFRGSHHRDNDPLLVPADTPTGSSEHPFEGPRLPRGVSPQKRGVTDDVWGSHHRANDPPSAPADTPTRNGEHPSEGPQHPVRVPLALLGASNLSHGVSYWTFHSPLSLARLPIGVSLLTGWATRSPSDRPGFSRFRKTDAGLVSFAF